MGVVKWEGGGNSADITFGDATIVKSNKVPKVLLITLIISIVLILGAGIYFREYIYDIVVNPAIIMTADAADVEVNTEFDPKAYVLLTNEQYYTYEVDDSNVDISKLGDYIVHYKSSNKVQTTEYDLTVHVVDTTPPEIELTDEMITVVRDKEADNFNPTKYLKSVSDNFSEKENIKIDFTKDLNFKNDELQVIYSATDEAGNVGTKVLNIAVTDSRDALEAQIRAEQEKERLEKEEQERERLEQLQQEKEEQKKQQGQQPSGQQQQQPTQQEQPKPSAGVSLTASPVTIQIGTDMMTAMQMCGNAVDYRNGSGSAMPTDIAYVNFTVPGTYTVTWTCTEGLSCTQTVTVVE